MRREMEKFNNTVYEVIGYIPHSCHPDELESVKRYLRDRYCTPRPEPVYISHDDLRALCIGKNWFTCGSNYQYDKLFELADTGDIDRVATLIWGCSDEQAGTVDHIKLELLKAAM